jgi:hypothetical protein
MPGARLGFAHDACNATVQRASFVLRRVEPEHRPEQRMRELDAFGVQLDEPRRNCGRELLVVPVLQNSAELVCGRFAERGRARSPAAGSRRTCG